MQVAGFSDAREIGRGGFATVYAARSDETGADVALKVFQTSESDRRRIERELVALEKLAGIPGVVPVLGVTEADDGSPVIVMPLLPDTMSSRMAAGGVSPELAVGWLADIGTAVDQATLAGVHHRDIKPNNVLIDGAGRALLADFGISAFAEMDTGTTTASAFSPPYAAPERLAGSMDIDLTSSDVYSLAATTWAAIVGDAPFGTATTGGVSGLISRVMANELDPPTSMPPALFDVLRTGMALDPAARYSTASALVGAARYALDRPDDVTVVRLPTSVVPVAAGAAPVAGVDADAPGGSTEGPATATATGDGDRAATATGDGAGDDSDGLHGPPVSSNGRKVALVAACLLFLLVLAGAAFALVGRGDDIRTVEKASSTRGDRSNPTVTVESESTEKPQPPETTLPGFDVGEPAVVTAPPDSTGGPVPGMGLPTGTGGSQPAGFSGGTAPGPAAPQPAPSGAPATSPPVTAPQVTTPPPQPVACTISNGHATLSPGIAPLQMAAQDANLQAPVTCQMTRGGPLTGTLVLPLKFPSLGFLGGTGTGSGSLNWSDGQSTRVNATVTVTLHEAPLSNDLVLMLTFTSGRGSPGSAGTDTIPVVNKFAPNSLTVIEITGMNSAFTWNH